MNPLAVIEEAGDRQLELVRLLELHLREDAELDPRTTAPATIEQRKGRHKKVVVPPGSQGRTPRSNFFTVKSATVSRSIRPSESSSLAVGGKATGRSPPQTLQGCGKAEDAEAAGIGTVDCCQWVTRS